MDPRQLLQVRREEILRIAARHEQQAEAAKLDAAIVVNLRELGFWGTDTP